MKKIIFIVLLVSLFLSACGEDIEKDKYYIRFSDGREEVVEYDYCRAEEFSVSCWNDYKMQAPDVTYFEVSELRVLNND